MRNILLFSVLACFFGCVEKLQPQGAPPPPPLLPVMNVATGVDTTFLDYPASVQGAVNVEIRPQISGKLAQILFDEGSYVKKGAVIFKIDDQPFKAQLNNSLASLEAAKGSEAGALLEVQKLEPLVLNKVVSPFQLKSAKASLQVAKASAGQARAQVESAKINLAYSLVKAPVNGYIGLLAKKVGSLVAPTDPEPLTLLSDIHTVHVYFSLSENDFATFKEQFAGKTISDKLKQMPQVDLLLSDNSPFKSKGKVDMVSGQFDKTTGAITFRATFPNNEGLLRSGNTGKLRLGLIHRNELVVPQSATVELQDKIFIYIVSDSNKVKKQAIAIAGKSHEHYLVKSGVSAGDLIVLSGLDRLQDGEKIRPDRSAEKVAKQ